MKFKRIIKNQIKNSFYKGKILLLSDQDRLVKPLYLKILLKKLIQNKKKLFFLIATIQATE